MLSVLWHSDVYGCAKYVAGDSVIVSPRFGEGNWRGGWWTRFDRDSGAVVWRRYHRRGADLFAVLDDVIVASTFKNSGVYVFSFESGRRIWARLGERCDWLLKLCDYLPADNGGDGPVAIYNGRILTRYGRLLDLKSGRIVSHYSLEHGRDGIKSVDGKPFERSVKDVFVHGRLGGKTVENAKVDSILEKQGLELSEHYASAVESGSCTLAIACQPAGRRSGRKRARLHRPAKPLDIPHWLYVFRSSDGEVLYREELGCYYKGDFSWVNARTVAVALQTVGQWNWGFGRRQIRLYDRRTA